MSLPRRCVSRPVATLSAVLVLLLIGAATAVRLGLDIFPHVELPFVTVITVWPGASPRELEQEVAREIEDVLATIDGLKHMTSTCMENVCQTLFEFQLTVDPDQAATDVREKLDLVLDKLPEGAEKPKVLKFDPNSKAVVQLALTGPVPIDELYDWADQVLSDRLSVLEGVASVELIGGEEKEAVIQLDRRRLAGRGLTVIDIVRALI